MTDDFNKTMLLAIKILEEQPLDYVALAKNFTMLYPFTTENIAGYIDLFDLQNKSLLTVGSSLDQAFNAIEANCRDITVLDLNPQTKFYYFLKTAALLELNRQEFLEYLRFKDYPSVFKDNRKVFNKETFNKLKKTLRLLDYESYLYWDELFENYSPIKVRTSLFSLDEDRTNTIVGCNKYLQTEENYESLRSKIKKYPPKFITADIYNAKLNRKYDNIWLSNIFYHLQDGESEKIGFLTKKMVDALNENGKLLISYLYDTVEDTRYQEEWRDIYNLEKISETLHEFSPTFEKFPGISSLRFNNKDFKDSILIYQKR